MKGSSAFDSTVHATGGATGSAVSTHTVVASVENAEADRDDALHSRGSRIGGAFCKFAF